MDEETHALEIPQDAREAFVLCLALGTLEAMRKGDWPREAGIWTLGRPVFWEPLIEVDSRVVGVFQEADELALLEKLCGRATAEEKLDRMIATIRSRLLELPEKSWYARWSDGDSA